MPLKEFENQFRKPVMALKNAIRNNKIAHAYLLHCDERRLGEGFANALAQALSCRNKMADGDACGKCEICVNIAKGTYPELFLLMPTSKSRKIKVGDDENDQDSLRWFQSLFYYRAAFSSGKKIGIIFDADTMMVQAQNAFLKTLEEPPADSYFIVCTANPSELLPTFRSRCQRLTILRNSHDYQEEERNMIIGILDNLCGASGSIETVEKAAVELAAVFDALRHKAESNVAERWKNAISMGSMLDVSGQSRIEERLDAAQSAEYILLRGKILSLIHSYFFQLWQVSKGIDPDTLPNPEILPKEKNFLDGEIYSSQFRNAEDFMKSMKLNVDAALAIRTFCYSFFCMASRA